MEWNLQDIYRDIESNKLKNDIENMKNSLDKLKNSLSKIDQDNFNEWLKLLDEYQILLIENEKIDVYLNLQLLVDSTNEQTVILSQKTQDILSNINDFEMSLVENVTDDILDIFTNHKYWYYIKKLLNKKSKSGAFAKEKILSQVSQFSSNNWMLLHKTNLGKIKIENKTAAIAQTMQLNKSENIRRNGYYLEHKIAKKAAEVSIYAINAIKAENILEANIRGYDSVLEMSLDKSGIKKDYLTGILDSVEKLLPSLIKYRYKKDNNVKYYNMLSTTKHNVKYDLKFNEVLKIVESAFSKFSKTAQKVVINSIKDNLIDYSERLNKRGGACCNSIYANNKSYVLLTYSGSYKNYITISHELGHSFHHFLLNKNVYYDSQAPMPISEMVSTFFELVCSDELLSEYCEYKDIILEGNINSVSSTFTDVYNRYLFEQQLITKRKEGFITVYEMCDLMKEAQKRVFGDNGDDESYNSYSWVVKPHYYYASIPYYNYPYIVGKFAAVYFYYRYKHEGQAFVVEFEKILVNSGRQTTEDTLKQLGFTEGNNCIEKAMEIINLWLKKL